MANISKTPDYYYQLRNGCIRQQYSSPAVLSLGKSNSTNTAAGYLLQFPINAAVTAASIEVTLDMTSLVTPFTLVCSLYVDSAPEDNHTPLATTSVQISQDETTVTKKFSFSGLSVNAESLSFRIEYAANNWGMSIQSAVTVAATYTMPTLTVSPSPATVYDMPSSILPSYTNTVTLTFGNRIGQTLHVQFKYSSTVVWDFYNIDEDSYSENMSGFFEAAGATGSSITVRVDVSDELGRTANASFTLIKPQGSTATPTAPKNTTVDGTLPVNFAWSMSSGYGDQKKAELQYSTDNAAWEDLATINGSAQTWTASKLTFPGGTIYWRVRVTNDFGVVGAWSPSVSFTARYDAVSQVYPVNSQTSGNFSRTAEKTFYVGLETTGEVPTPFTIASAVFHWRAGTSGEWTDVAMTRASGNLIAYVVITGGTFPAGQMQWCAEATDNTGRTTETDVFTLTALVSSIQTTPVRPINTVESGDAPIVFQWRYASVDGGYSRGALWSVSQDGETWDEYELIKSGDGRPDGLDTFSIGAGFFQAGTVYWKVRSQNSAGEWGPYSEVVSFRVLGAPTVEGVTGDGKPFLTITWQTPTDSDYRQQAYKIEVDGKLYGPYFGSSVRSYTLKEPLDDGPHTVRVAAQNRFGLWSEWAEGNVVVTNIPGPVFSVMAVASDPAAVVFMLGATIAPIITRQPQDYQRGTDGNVLFQLSNKTWTNFNPANPGYKPIRTWEYKGPNENTWHTIADSTYFMVSVPVTSANNGYQYRGLLSNAVGELYSEPATFYYREPAGPAADLKEGEWKAPTGYFLIYRDGELVGKTYENFFFDMAAIGTVSYEVLQVLPDGYYTRGTVITESVDVTVSAPTLIPLGTTNFLRLTLSEDPRRVQDIRREAEVVYTQYEGAIYPEAEIGEHETLSVSGDCAWTWEERDKAEAFRSYLKKPVIYKTPGGERVVGVLTGYTKKDAHFYRTARFSIQQMDWRDYRDES